MEIFTVKQGGCSGFERKAEMCLERQLPPWRMETGPDTARYVDRRLTSSLICEGYHISNFLSYLNGFDSSFASIALARPVVRKSDGVGLFVQEGVQTSSGPRLDEGGRFGQPRNGVAQRTALLLQGSCGHADDLSRACQ